jgi:hypothetical protein
VEEVISKGLRNLSFLSYSAWIIELGTIVTVGKLDQGCVMILKWSAKLETVRI